MANDELIFNCPNP